MGLRAVQGAHGQHIKPIIKWKADFLLIKVVVINHGISLISEAYRTISGATFPEFRKWSDMASKVVRYGFESGPICFPKWSDMIFSTTISDYFQSHIGPLLKVLGNGKWKWKLTRLNVTLSPPSSSRSRTSRSLRALLSLRDMEDAGGGPIASPLRRTQRFFCVASIIT